MEISKIKRKNILLVLAGIMLIFPLLTSVYNDPANFFSPSGSGSSTYALGYVLGKLSRLAVSVYLIVEGFRK